MVLLRSQAEKQREQTAPSILGLLRSTFSARIATNRFNIRLSPHPTLRKCEVTNKKTHPHATTLYTCHVARADYSIPVLWLHRAGGPMSSPHRPLALGSISPHASICDSTRRGSPSIQGFPPRQASARPIIAHHLRHSAATVESYHLVRRSSFNPLRPGRPYLPPRHSWPQPA